MGWFWKELGNFKELYNAKFSILLWMESIMGIHKRSPNMMEEQGNFPSGRGLPWEDWQDRTSRNSSDDIDKRIKHLLGVRCNAFLGVTLTTPSFSFYR